MAQVMCGGIGESKPATEEIQQLCEPFRGDIEGKKGGAVSKFTAVSYKSQVVAGTNFFVKVDVGDEHVHLRIFRPLPHTGESPSLAAHQLGKSAEDEIEYFQ